MTVHRRHIFPGFFLGDFDDQGQLIRRVDKVSEETKGMDGKDSRLLCGVVGLQVYVGVAVAVGLDISVNGFLGIRLTRDSWKNDHRD